MAKYSIPVWKMLKKSLTDLGGEDQFVPLIDIVNRVRERWHSEDVNPGTIRCQVRIRCVNGHPGHDSYPDNGKLWREQPTFVSDRNGRYRLFNPETDQDIYKAALAEHGEYITDSDSIFNVPHQPLEPSTSPEKISGRIENVVDLLESCGHKLGFQAQREWSAPMARIDLVWYIELPIQLPQLDLNRLPIVAFEIETSWRTRKHLKGDIMNLFIIKPALGIILQQTGPEDDHNEVEGLIRNTRNYLQSSGNASILVWTDSDVLSLARSLEIPTEL